MTANHEPSAAHDLTVQQADALWDAVAVPGPEQPTFPAQHERVCRAVVAILSELPAVVSSPPATGPDAEIRRARYAAVIRKAGDTAYGNRPFVEAVAEAVIAVADTEQAGLRRERDLAIAHDRQPYPTAWAYEQACKALHAQRERADVAEAVIAGVRAAALRDAVEICDEAGAVYTSQALNEHAAGAYALMERFQRKAEEAEETSARTAATPPAAWIDGHPQLEAIASAVYERCETGDGGIVHDDPRNIAVAALKGLLAPGDRDDEAQQPEPTTAEKAAALGMTDAEYRAHSHRAAVDAIRAAIPGLYATVGLRVEDVLADAPAVGARQPDTETQGAARITNPQTGLGMGTGGNQPAPLAAGLPLVQGACPACHSSSLFLGDGGYVTCSEAACPEPDAATTALERQAAEPHPPHDSWLVEWRAEGGDWAVAYPTHDRSKALDRLARGRQEAPDWQWRLVRETASYSVDQPAGGAGGVADETGEGGDRLVAHVLATGTDLHCLRCAPPPYGDIWTPVIADELEDGGVCVRCGVDVLIPQETSRG